MITIAALNYWRGRGHDAPIRLNKIAFFTILNSYCLALYDWQVALQLNGVFGILFAIGTGGLMQTITGEKQNEMEFKPIDIILQRFFKPEGKLYGALFATCVGMLQFLYCTLFGFSFFNFSFLFLGIVIYLSRRWDYAEFNMALLWAVIIIGSYYAN
jgi:hypothetical protein